MESKTKSVNLKIAFKRLNSETGFFGKTICKVTNSIYYHVEIIIDDLWVSADSPMGVTIRPLEPVQHENWTYVDLGTRELLLEDYDIIMRYIEKQRGKGYDYLAIILSQLIPLKMHSKNKLFCSELVVLILKLFLVEEVLDLVPQSTSPKDLARLFGLKE